MEKKQHTTASGEDYLEAILALHKKMGADVFITERAICI